MRARVSLNFFFKFNYRHSVSLWRPIVMRAGIHSIETGKRAVGGQCRRAILIHNGWTKLIIIHLEESTEVCRVLTEAGCNRFRESSCPLQNG